jgi:hypothetical protein
VSHDEGVDNVNVNVEVVNSSMVYDVVRFMTIGVIQTPKL